MKVNTLKKLLMAALVALLAGGLAACDNDQGPAEEAGENIDESIDSAGQSIEEAGDEIENAAEN